MPNSPGAGRKLQPGPGIATAATATTLRAAVLLRRMSLSRSRVFPGVCTKAHEGVFQVAHNTFGQIKMEIPWYINWQTLISSKRDGKPRMIGGQYVVVRVGVHQLSFSPNTSHPMLQICSKLLHGNSMPSLNM